MACGSPSPKQAYQSTERDLGQTSNAFDADTQERITDRVAQLCEEYRAGKIQSGEDLHYTAAVLWRAQDVESLDLCIVIGHLADQKGHPGSLKYAAYATDRQCLMLGKPQRYGTQMVYVPVTDRWRLYATNPITTDEERAKMGIPPLAQLQERADRKNAEPNTLPLGPR
jgi:hypothetical protein